MAFSSHAMPSSWSMGAFVTRNHRSSPSKDIVQQSSPPHGLSTTPTSKWMLPVPDCGANTGRPPIEAFPTNHVPSASAGRHCSLPHETLRLSQAPLGRYGGAEGGGEGGGGDGGGGDGSGGGGDGRGDGDGHCTQILKPWEPSGS